jgi:hypothetical protein
MKDVDFKVEVTEAINKLELQGVLSKVLVNSNYNCLYQSENGACCIIGQMMPKNLRLRADKILKAGGDSSIRNLHGKWGFIKWSSKFTGLQIGLMSSFQKLHDNGWDSSFKGVIASMRNLLERELEERVL